MSVRSAVRDLTLTLTRDDARDQVRWWVDAGNSLWISGQRCAMREGRGATVSRRLSFAWTGGLTMSASVSVSGFLSARKEKGCKYRRRKCRTAEGTAEGVAWLLQIVEAISSCGAAA